MNKQKILDLADYIESTEHSADNDGLEDVDVAFNMSDFAKEGSCGTVGCIAGHALIFFKGLSPRELREYDDSRDIAAGASEILDLSGSEENHLFDPEWSMGCVNNLITPKQAAHALRYFASGETPREAWTEALGG